MIKYDKDRIPFILVVEDRSHDLNSLGNLLMNAGYLVAIESSGNNAMSIATSRIPDIIILDTDLTNLDGFKIFSQLKLNEETAKIPIVFIVETNASDEIDRVLDIATEAEAVAVSDFITRPLNQREVLFRIKNLLELKNTLLEIEQMSYFDTLSGLPNKRYFNLFADLEWKEAIRNQSEIAMILIDIDDFKGYNDTYGHIEGDHCIFKVSKALKTCIHRTSDFVARFGGEEFVCVLPGTDLNGAMKVAEIMRKQVELLKIENFNSNVNDYITISLGVSSYFPDQNSNLLQFINKVDKALYNAKQEGKNKMCYL